MISTIFSFLKAILGLTEHFVTSAVSKLEDSKPTIQSKLESATRHIKDRYDHT